MTLEALIERVEKATGPDRDLFLAVAAAVVPDYAADLDWRATFNSFIAVGAWENAALALVERVLPGCDWRVQTLPSGGFEASVILIPVIAHAQSETPSIALLLAMLRALEGETK